MNHCYCCSGRSFETCCEPLLSGIIKAQTPEALMRSRYSAFCCGNIAYLLNTAHARYLEAQHYPAPTKNNNNSPLQSGNKEIDALQQTINQTQWLGLKIIRTSNNQVEFCAFFKHKEDPHTLKPESTASNPKIEQLHERSEFIFEDGQWFYAEGEILPEIKTGRNDPCYCASNKKFKKCCGKSN